MSILELELKFDEKGGTLDRYRAFIRVDLMKILTDSQLAEIPCGEVGATKMGDDYHYTGSAGAVADYIMCLRAGDYWWSRLLVCMIE